MGQEASRSLSGWRRRTVSGAIAGAIAAGLRDVFDPDRRHEEPYVVDASGDDSGPDLIELHFHPQVPAMTWVVVHPARTHTPDTH